MKKPTIYLLLLLLLSTCTPKPDPSGRELSQPSKLLELNLITDTVNLDLHLIGKQVEIVPLEKTEEALIGGGVNTYVINQDFIVVESNQQMLLYSRDGSLIRILARKGKGPGEYVFPRLMKIYNNHVYYTDAGKPGNDLLGINLITGELSAINLVKQNIRLSDYFLSDNGLTIVADSTLDERLIRMLYQQDEKGDEWYETFLGVREVNNRAHMGPYNLLTDARSLFMVNPQGDSVMQVHPSGLELAFRIVLPDASNDNNGRAQAIQLNLMTFNSTSLLAIKRTINIQPGRIRMSFPHYLYFDRIIRRGHFFEKFTLSDYGIELSPLSLCVEEAPTLCFEIHAVDFMEKVKAALTSQNLTSKHREQLSDLAESLSEEDNPVLIIIHLNEKGSS